MSSRFTVPDWSDWELWLPVAIEAASSLLLTLQQSRLEVARKLGADYLINGATQNVVEELQKIAPEGADVVFESTGVPACVDPAIELCRAAR